MCDSVVKTTEIQPARVEEFIEQMMPWAKGHQMKAIYKFVHAIPCSFTEVIL
jgi:hypothetical protein